MCSSDLVYDLSGDDRIYSAPYLHCIVHTHGCICPQCGTVLFVEMNNLSVFVEMVSASWRLPPSKPPRLPALPRCSFSG